MMTLTINGVSRKVEKAAWRVIGDVASGKYIEVHKTDDPMVCCVIEKRDFMVYSQDWMSVEDFINEV